MKKLTDKQEIFCREYLVDLNGTQAAIRAGYSKKTANRIATENLSKPVIQARVAALVEARAEKLEVDAEWVLRRLVDEATADFADLYAIAGGIKPVHDWPLIWRQGLVTGLDVQQDSIYEDGEPVPDGMVVKIKMSDRIKRVELIGRHVKIQAFKDQMTVDTSACEARLDAAIKGVADRAKEWQESRDNK